MSTVPTKAYLQAKLVLLLEERAQSQKNFDTELANLTALIERANQNEVNEGRWGNDSQFMVDEILTWRRTFGRNSRRRNTYTFVAIKSAPDKWRVRDTYMSWDTLVNDYFTKADRGEVYRVVKLELI